MRQNLVAGNWKMNLTYPEALALVSEIVNMAAAEATRPQAPQVVVCPPFPLLHSVGKLLPQGGRFHLGAQNCHQQASGAFTGEVAASMLASVGCEYVILGHSERRQYFQEDDDLLGPEVESGAGGGLAAHFLRGRIAGHPRSRRNV